MSYRYNCAEPAHTCAYLWPEVISILQRQRHAHLPCDIFEIGCGNGATARMLAAQGYSVTGIDPSPSGIDIARQYASDNLRFEVGSTSDDLSSRFGQFPIVLSLEVIEHCASAREFMRGFTSVMAPGGVGIISTPYHCYLKNLAIVASGKFDFHFNPLWENGHLRFFSIPKLRELFDEFGLRYEFVRVGRIPPLAKSVIAIVQRS